MTFALALRTSLPSNFTLPLRGAFDGTRPMIERDRTDLPQPDSPTTPIVLPRWSVKDTPRTACTLPRSESNVVLRSVTSSSGALGSTGAMGAFTGSPPSVRSPAARSQGTLPDVEVDPDRVAQRV